MNFTAKIAYSSLAILLALWLLPFSLWATHIRAGEIRAVRVNSASLSYNFIVTIYTDSNSTNVDVDELKLFYGDGTFDTQRRDPANKVAIPGAETFQSTFYFSHTYSGNRTYTVFTWVANRNADVLNMSNSVETTFYVETEVIIDPNIPPNSTPILTVPPVDKGQFGKIWTHNPGAYDPDGDSLSYEFVPCRQWDEGRQIVRQVGNFVQPHLVVAGTNVTNDGPATFTVNNRGDIVWNCPNLKGQYNIAIKITEWRRLRNRVIPIGYVIRDMQIVIEDGRNKEPTVFIPEDTCVVAGARLLKTIRGTDPDRGDKVVLTAYGYPFEFTEVLPNHKHGTFKVTTPQSSPAISTFDWTTSCLDVQDQPILVVFKAADIPVVKFRLSDVKSWQIRVIAPKPKFTGIAAQLGKINLSWENYINTVCSNATSIQIWRRVDSSFYKGTACETGIPKGEPYQLIANVGATETQFTDDNGGKLLDNGQRYCYRLVATFPQPAGGKSYASDEVCATLKLEMPVMLEVNTLDTTARKGRIAVKWSRPLEMDTNVYPPPYQYRIFRQDTLTRTIAEVYRATRLSDTSFIDTGLNTATNLYKYQVAMYFSPQVLVKDTSDFAQQINLKARGRNKSIVLNYSTATPWTNRGYTHYIFRKAGSNWALIDSILGTGNTMQYEDKGLFENQSLVKGIEYEYAVKTIGRYGNPKVPKPLPNLSPIVKGSLFDSTPPCKPVLTITSPPCNDCAAFKAIVNPQNLLSWTDNSQTCDSLVKQYKVYYKAHETDEVYILVGSTRDTFLYHSNAGSLAGCYYVQAISFSDIIGPPSNELCLDNCVFADLPNVFTPNGDSYNQVFRFICAASSFIKNTQVKIYNRWGNLIYDAPQVAAESLWDGKSGSKLMEDGLYYYEVTCEYQRLKKADESLRLKGWLMLLRD